LRFGRDGAESTTRAYAGAIALFLRWCARTGKDWQAGAEQLGLFMTWLAHAGPAASGIGAEPGAGGLAGPGRGPGRAAGRLMARAGLRRGEALGLRRGDVHLLTDSRELGCEVARAHLHVVRRDGNPNGAVAKSRRERAVPLDFLVVQAFDSYEFERMGVPA